MAIRTRIAALTAVVALLLTPTAALAGGPEYAPEHPAHPTHPTPGPKASLPEKAKAYGVYCRGFSKKHESGRKGTPFSNCVTAMAKAATVPSTIAKSACKGLPKAHVQGQTGTEFSRCVVAAAKLSKDQLAS